MQINSKWQKYEEMRWPQRSLFDDKYALKISATLYAFMFFKCFILNVE